MSEIARFVPKELGFTAPRAINTMNLLAETQPCRPLCSPRKATQPTVATAGVPQRPVQGNDCARRLTTRSGSDGQGSSQEGGHSGASRGPNTAVGRDGWTCPQGVPTMVARCRPRCPSLLGAQGPRGVALRSPSGAGWLCQFPAQGLCWSLLCANGGPLPVFLCEADGLTLT